ncbi:hypothetical protein LDENG_00162750 [Lucifuga dentata]|nr:hypothetical protein LDENG_00162750 [Lucifuga dentata]
MYPDLFGLGGAGTVPACCSSSSSTKTTAAVISSAASVKDVSSVPGALLPFMLSSSMGGMSGMAGMPGMAGMSGMAGVSGLLPPGFPLSYTQSLASLYSGSMFPSVLSVPAATPGPAGSSFLSQYPPTAASTSSSSPSPSSSSPSVRSESHRGPVRVENGGNVSSTGISDDNDDDGDEDDVIEVMGH